MPSMIRSETFHVNFIQISNLLTPHSLHSPFTIHNKHKSCFSFGFSSLLFNLVCHLVIWLLTAKDTYASFIEKWMRKSPHSQFFMEFISWLLIFQGNNWEFCIEHFQRTQKKNAFRQNNRKKAMTHVSCKTTTI